MLCLSLHLFNIASELPNSENFISSLTTLVWPSDYVSTCTEKTRHSLPATARYKKHQTLFQALLTHYVFEGKKVKPAKNLQKEISIQWVLDYADCLDRTSDLLITSEMRYHCAKPALIGDR